MRASRPQEYARMHQEILANERLLLFHLYYDIGLDLGYKHLLDKCMEYQTKIGASARPGAAARAQDRRPLTWAGRPHLPCP